MIENSVFFNNLLAWYGTLLTDKQLEIMKCYYQDDLSLAEIAANHDVSRSAVHDSIKRSEELLIHYENKLKVYDKFNKRAQAYESLKELGIEQVNEIVLKLEEIE